MYQKFIVIETEGSLAFTFSHASREMTRMFDCHLTNVGIIDTHAESQWEFPSATAIHKHYAGLPSC